MQIANEYTSACLLYLYYYLLYITGNNNKNSYNIFYNHTNNSSSNKKTQEHQNNSNNNNNSNTTTKTTTTTYRCCVITSGAQIWIVPQTVIVFLLSTTRLIPKSPTFTWKSLSTYLYCMNDFFQICIDRGESEERWERGGIEKERGGKRRESGQKGGRGEGTGGRSRAEKGGGGEEKGVIGGRDWNEKARFCTSKLCVFKSLWIMAGSLECRYNIP